VIDPVVSSGTAASGVIRVCNRQAKDPLQVLITDAYATVAIAYRRAAAVYILDEVQKMGTAAVHLVR
jgi:hypothetical protein